jgi:hypothetical protein
MIGLQLQPWQALGKIHGDLDLVFHHDRLFAQALQFARTLGRKTIGRSHFEHNHGYGQQVGLMLPGKPWLANGRQGDQRGEFCLKSVLDSQRKNRGPS